MSRPKTSDRTNPVWTRVSARVDAGLAAIAADAGVTKSVVVESIVTAHLYGPAAGVPAVRKSANAWKRGNL